MAFAIEKHHFKTESILEGLPATEMRLLRAGIRRVKLAKGKMLFKEGAYSKGMYIVLKGKLKISQVNAEGRESITYIFGKGEVLGYRPLLSGEPHPTSGAALEDCLIAFIPKKVFLHALDHSPVLCRRLLVNLAHEFSVLVHKVSMFAGKPVKERVALALRILNEKYKREGKAGLPVVINLSRDTIASYAGTTTETLVRMLRHLKDEQIIKTDGRKIIILEPAMLEKIAR